MIKPIGKYIALSEIKEEIKTTSSLYMSSEETLALHYKKASVVAIGTDVKDIKVEDVIYYHKGGSFEMTIDSKPIIWIQERDVLCVL